MVRDVDPTVVEDLTASAVSLAEIQRVLHQLLAEQVPIRDLTRILEVISERARVARRSRAGGGSGPRSDRRHHLRAPSGRRPPPGGDPRPAGRTGTHHLAAAGRGRVVPNHRPRYRPTARRGRWCDACEDRTAGSANRSSCAPPACGRRSTPSWPACCLTCRCCTATTSWPTISPSTTWALSASTRRPHDARISINPHHTFPTPTRAPTRSNSHNRLTDRILTVQIQSDRFGLIEVDPNHRCSNSTTDCSVSKTTALRPRRGRRVRRLLLDAVARQRRVGLPGPRAGVLLRPYDARRSRQPMSPRPGSDGSTPTQVLCLVDLSRGRHHRQPAGSHHRQPADRARPVRWC